jgi:hypothetical protein
MTLVSPYANWSVESSHPILSIRSGGSVVSIGAYRSHSSTSITQDIYAHSVSEAERAAIDGVFGA